MGSPFSASFLTQRRKDAKEDAKERQESRFVFAGLLCAFASLREKSYLQIMTPLDHLVDRLSAARVELDPFPHFYLEHILPDDYYHELLNHLPATDVYDNLYEVTDLKLDHFRHRHQRDMNEGWTERLPHDLQPFWNSFNEWFLGPDLAQSVLESFSTPRAQWPQA